MTRDGAEAAAPKVAAALAEVGFPNVAMHTYRTTTGEWSVGATSTTVTLEAWFLATLIAVPDDTKQCWPCYSANQNVPGYCGHDVWAQRPRLERAS